VLEAVMHVNQRPDNEFAQSLSEYRALIGIGHGEAPAATALRRRLETMSPDDPALAAADVEIRRHRIMQDLAQRA